MTCTDVILKLALGLVEVSRRVETIAQRAVEFLMHPGQYWMLSSNSSWYLTGPIRRSRDRITQIWFRLRRGVALKPTEVLPQDPGIVALPTRTIFIECTHTYHSDVNTGIQRVVRNIIRNAPEVAARYGFQVLPVIVENGRFEVVDAEHVLLDKQGFSTQGAVADSVPVSPPPQVIKGFLVRLYLYFVSILSALLPFASARKFLNAPKTEFGLARCLVSPSLFAHWLRGLPKRGGLDAINTLRHLDDVQNHEGNVLLFLDASWHLPVWDPTDRFIETGGKVVGITYDLIPISHPDSCAPEVANLYRAWIAKYVTRSSGSIAISNTVASQIRDYAHEQGWAKWSHPNAPIHHFYLGSELDFTFSGSSPSQRIVDIFASDQPTFLMVGSIEPRKMHSYVLDAFDNLWAGGAPVRLVIVGRQHWRTESFLERVAQHPRLGSDLFLLRDATDDELEACYAQATALVIASKAEGFGLPIVEAFQRALPVICSDIPVFREIAGSNADFFKLDDPEHLAQAVSEFCMPRAHGDTIRRKINWLTWHQSTEQLFHAVDQIVNLTRNT